MSPITWRERERERERESMKEESEGYAAYFLILAHDNMHCLRTVYLPAGHEYTMIIAHLITTLWEDGEYHHL
jgi:hypothetical protein